MNPTIALANGAAPPSTHAVTVVKTTDGSVWPRYYDITVAMPTSENQSFD
jgi:hypothetical protein